VASLKRPTVPRAGSIFVRQHDRDRGSRVVNVERATHGNELDESRGLVVVADVEGERQARLAVLRFADGKTEHPNNIPKPAGFVLASNTGRDSDKAVKDSVGEKNRETDSGFLGNFRNLDLEAIGKGLGARGGGGHRTENVGGGSVLVVHGLI